MCTWRIRYCNSIHIMNPSTPLPWDSSNNAFILLIKFGFTVLHSYNHRNTFCYYWFYFWYDYNFLCSYKYQLNSSKHYDTLNCSFLFNNIMNQRFKILSFLFKLFKLFILLAILIIRR